jgi:DNA-binding response OmpR family regulator
MFNFIHSEWKKTLLSGRDLYPLGARRWVRALSDLLVILVVEDDAPIQSLVEDALADVGFEPAIAASGEEAVTLLIGNKGKYRALVTDIQLRGVMEGWEVAKKAREIDPEFPIVYITGGNAADWPSHGMPNSILLTKPFAPAQLAAAVSQLLNAGSPPTAPS